MDDSAFDHLAQQFDRLISRRATFGGLVGVGLGAALAGGGAEVAAKKKKPKTCPAGKDVCSIASLKKVRKAKCGPKGSGCFCVTGTSATICSSFADSLCDETGDICQTDADCDAITGPGSVCALLATAGHCTCGASNVNGVKACQAPCPSPGANGQGQNAAGAAMRVHLGRR